MGPDDGAALMEALAITIGRGGHVAGGLAFMALAVWQVHGHGFASRAQTALVAALLATAAWSVLAGTIGWAAPLTMLAETARNIGWLLFLYLLLDDAGAAEQPGGLKAVYWTMFAICGATIAMDAGLASLSWGGPDAAAAATQTVRAVADAVADSALVLRMIVAVGALLLVHHLYRLTAPELRGGIGLPLAALAALWTWDFNLYTISSLSGIMPPALAAMRGAMLCMLVPVVALGLARNRNWQLRLSRRMAFQSVSMLLVGAYLLVMMVLAAAIDRWGGEQARLAQVGMIFGLSLLALLILPSGQFRAWLKVKLAKHFYQHRYDYRAEWGRFTETLGQPDAEAPQLARRVVQAIGDIVECPAGLLMVPGSGGVLHIAAAWNWRGMAADGAGDLTIGEHGRRFFETSGHIAELDAVRAERDQHIDPAAIPEWLWQETRAWAVVPLIHFGQLHGLVVLSRPRIARSLDWEDFDLLRVAGRQAASYLAEAGGQAALVEARQFDEFNRRFAFIMHDIKNLVSQLSLVARNAERHADNPAFRADMIATLKSSVDKMNAMLARLSQHHRARADQPADHAIAPLVARALAAYQTVHPIDVDGATNLVAHVDPARLDTILAHLVQNAIDASPKGAAVRVHLRRRGSDVGIDVIDDGPGMDAQFVHHELFKPFVSTKADGFGIGAYEARALAEAMGGRIQVDSQPGVGSRFTIWLAPATDTILASKAA